MKTFKLILVTCFIAVLIEVDDAIRHYDSREDLSNDVPEEGSYQSGYRTPKRRPVIGVISDKWRAIMKNKHSDGENEDDIGGPRDSRTFRKYQDAPSHHEDGGEENSKLYQVHRSQLADGPALKPGLKSYEDPGPSKTWDGEKQPKPSIPEQVHQFFFSGFEAARVSYFGAALKYFTEQFEDIHDYNYIIGPTGEKAPEFCGNYYCAKFEILCRNELYEVRYYYGFTVATARVNGVDFVNSGLRKAYYKIIRYFGGENDKRVKIPWTVPNALLAPTKGIGNPKTQLLELLKGGEGPAVNVAIPPPFGQNPPLPDDPDIVITKLPDHVVYVKMFGGYALPYVMATKSKEFAQILLLKGHNVTGPVIAGIYNKPTTFVNRHNELYYFVEKDLPYSEYC